jgi:hypothetical protein
MVQIKMLDPMSTSVTMQCSSVSSSKLTNKLGREKIECVYGFNGKMKQAVGNLISENVIMFKISFRTEFHMETELT